MIKWQDMDPSARRNVVIYGALAAVVLVFVVIGTSEDSEPRRHAQQESIKNVLGDRDTREFGIQELQSQLKALKKKDQQDDRKQGRLEGEIQSLKERTTSNSDTTRKIDIIEEKMDGSSKELSALMAELKAVKQELDDVRSTSDKAIRQSTEASQRAAQARADVKASDKRNGSSSGVRVNNGGQSANDTTDVQWSGTNVNSTNGSDPTSYFQTAALPSDTDDKGKRKKGGIEAPTIRQIGGNSDDEQHTDVTSNEDEGVYIPAGSILTGVLLNGMDAPTKTEASKNPYPATMRIQHEAILPNYFTADVRECFLIISGFGDLSAERAYLRGETISCVRDDGGVIEASIKGYATGEDGKAGIRGRLVSKSGQILAKAMQAGFLEGLAGAFKSNPIPVVQTSGITSEALFQEAMSKDSLANGALSGTGNALERIADYYLSLAEDIFPVIEIDAGRVVSFSLTKGTMLKFKSKAG